MLIRSVVCNNKNTVITKTPKENLEVCVLVAQLCLTLCDLLECSPPGSSVHGILQARILKQVAIPLGTTIEKYYREGVHDRQGGLACCDSWGRRVGHD